MIRRLCAVALLVVAASCGHKDAQSTTSTTTTTAQTPSAAAPVTALTVAPVGTVVPVAVNPPGFASETSAKAHCPTDEVVWLNTKSKIYHEKGTHYYGTTKQGEYACRKEADAVGDRKSKS